jgi:hypothetical protein
MAISITGIKLHDLWIGESDDQEKITAHYQLVTSEGKCIGAKESLSTGKGYGENTFIPSPQTKKALQEAVRLYRKDVEISLGLETT